MFLKAPKDTYVVEGNTAELQCLVSGKPKPKILWKRNSNSPKHKPTKKLLFFNLS